MYDFPRKFLFKDRAIFGVTKASEISQPGRMSLAMRVWKSDFHRIEGSLTFTLTLPLAFNTAGCRVDFAKFYQFVVVLATYLRDHGALVANVL